MRRCLVTESPVRLGVLNIGFSRYRLPLDPHQKKKFESLSEMAELHVVRLAPGRSFVPILVRDITCQPEAVKLGFQTGV